MTTKQFTLYDQSSGRLLCNVSIPAVHANDYPVPDGAAVFDEFVENCDSAYVDTDGPTPALVLIPPKPSEIHFFDYQTKTWALDVDALKLQVRIERGILLGQSDWTQLPDVPLATKEAWAVYRQALRDISEQSGFPVNVVWPTPPAE